MKIRTLLISCSFSIVMALLAPASGFADGCHSSTDGKASLKHSNVAHNTLVDVAERAGSFSVLTQLLQEAGLDATLQGDGPFTVFAPSDEAFAKLPKQALMALKKDPEKLKQVLTYHVVAGRVPASKVVSLSSVKTVQGDAVRIQSGANVTLNEARVVKTDIEAENGIIHVIDSVLMPNS